MSYNAQEISVEAGSPIELYDIRIGTEVFTFTTHVLAVTYASIAYEPLEVQRESLAIGPEDRAETIKLTVPASHPFVRKYITSLPGQQATLTIRRVQLFDGSNEVLQLAKGVVRSVGFTLNGLKAEIAVMPISGNLTNALPRFVFSSLCNNVLFDQGCTVASSLFRYTGLVSGVSGDTITVSGLTVKGSGWAIGGFIALPTNESRSIIAHTGDVIRVNFPFPVSPLGATVDVFAGCDHSALTCATKFNNGINHGGYAFVPLRNIFNTGIV